MSQPFLGAYLLLESTVCQIRLQGNYKKSCNSCEPQNSICINLFRGQAPLELILEDDRFIIENSYDSFLAEIRVVRKKDLKNTKR